MLTGHYTIEMMNRRPQRTDEESNDGLVTDRQLLRQFVKHNDERAFTELVFRYGGLVLDICRRILRDEHSAEDAFQATFLVLARRASQIRNRSSLAAWLYAVAYRTACRANAERQRRREEELRGNMMAADDILAQVTSRYEQQLLDEELNSLPAKYRESLVLRYLLGKSNKQVADELGLRVGVVEGRIKRGKDRLRLRLMKRGVSLVPALAAIHVSSAAVKAATTDSLVATTVQAAAAFRGGGGSNGARLSRFLYEWRASSHRGARLRGGVFTTRTRHRFALRHHAACQRGTVFPKRIHGNIARRRQAPPWRQDMIESRSGCEHRSTGGKPRRGGKSLRQSLISHHSVAGQRGVALRAYDN